MVYKLLSRHDIDDFTPKCYDIVGIISKLNDLLCAYSNLSNIHKTILILLDSKFNTLENYINDHFFQLALISKSVEGSNLARLSAEVTSKISSYLKNMLMLVNCMNRYSKR
ncbi:MAG: hypothetical protein AB8U25_00450 [Rickettsiales endosymbiont of Dermacentor nuttalli]